MATALSLFAVMADDFIVGADFSHLALFESRGIVYREGGQPVDALALLKSRGLNCVRLRLLTPSRQAGLELSEWKACDDPREFNDAALRRSDRSS